MSRMDYAGISILISGSTFPPNYYGFYWQPNLWLFFIILIWTLWSLALLVTFHPSGDKPKCRKVRGILYIVVGISAGTPLYYNIYLK